MFGFVFVSDGPNEGLLIMALHDIYCSACSPLVWNSVGLLHMCTTAKNRAISVESLTVHMRCK